VRIGRGRHENWIDERVEKHGGRRAASVSGSGVYQATASTIAHKYRRALKNGTGANLTLPDLQLLAHLGALDLVTRAENEEFTNLARDTFPFVVGDHWLNQRRDGKADGIW
jgi:hypothetical protein